jgi:ubiquinone/menaquinone biosynthesis C-methylase UbiE
VSPAEIGKRSVAISLNRLGLLDFIRHDNFQNSHIGAIPSIGTSLYYMVRKLHTTQCYMTQFDMKTYSQRIKTEEFRSWNDEMIRKYDPDAFHRHSNPIIRYIEGKRLETILELMDKNDKEGRVIDVGCGAGNILEKVPSGNLFGIDISAFILFKARERLGENASLLQSDAQSLPYKGQTFKQVICSEVLEHLLDPSAALNEMARVLRAEGVAIVSVPNESMINRIKRILIRLGVFKWLFQRKGSYSKMPENMQDEWHLHTFTLNEWLNLFRKFFGVTRVRKIPFFWIPLRYVVRLEKRA